MLEKIKEYLISGDLEIVRLGVLLLQETEKDNNTLLAILHKYIKPPIEICYIDNEIIISLSDTFKWTNVMIKDPTRLLKLVPKNPVTGETILC